MHSICNATISCSTTLLRGTIVRVVLTLGTHATGNALVFMIIRIIKFFYELYNEPALHSWFE